MKWILILVAAVFSALAGYAPQATASSTNPLMGANYVVLKNGFGYPHDLFGSSYNVQNIENALQVLQESGMKYVRVFDGPLLPTDPLMTSGGCLPAGTKQHILDFLDRAKNHNLTVYFQFSFPFEQWVQDRYRKQTGQDFKEYISEFTDIGKAIYAERIRCITKETLATRNQNIIISLINEPHFGEVGDVTTQRNKAITWTNYMRNEVRAVDTNSNHLLTVALVQGNAPAIDSRGPWRPDDLYNFTTLDLIDMHFYPAGGPETWNTQLETVFGWWARYATKPVMISEMGVSTSLGNEKDAAKGMVGMTSYIRNNLPKIGGIIVWTATPYFGNYDIVGALQDGLFYRLMDGNLGYTRFGTAIFNDRFLEPTFSTNYATAGGYPAANVDDYRDNTHSVVAHIPSYSAPNETTIEYGQWYRFHRIRIVDNLPPYPKDFDVLVAGATGWELFKRVRGNTSGIMDIDSTQLSGWQSGHAIKIRVYDEQGNWSSISSICVNPVLLGSQSPCDRTVSR